MKTNNKVLDYVNRERLSRDSYFIQIAELTALRGTCDRAYVGAVAVKDKRIIMSGYNGSPSGIEHCGKKHYIINGHCEATIHAEQNIIVNAAKHGIALNDSTIYVTYEPCFVCLKLLIGAGVKRVVYKIKKKDIRTPKSYYKKIKVVQYKDDTFNTIDQLYIERSNKKGR